MKIQRHRPPVRSRENEVADRLSPTKIRDQLTTAWLGRELHCYGEVDSTNTVARELARQGAANGTVVLAESQTRGRGRLGRTWVSPPFRNLYLSIVLRPDLAPRHLPRIGLLAGVAVCDAVRKQHPADLKWPNDVLINGRKVAGILTEMEGAGTTRAVVLGIGVNLNLEREEFPPELREAATSLKTATGTDIDRAAFTGRMLAHIEARYEELCRDGFGPIVRAWHERSAMAGRRVRIREPGGEVSGVVMGLGDDGALRLRLDSGTQYRVVAGDVTVVQGPGTGNLTTGAGKQGP